MAIQTKCEKGHPFRSPDSHAGRRVACPTCGAPTTVPAARLKVTEREILEFLGPPDPPIAPAAAESNAPEPTGRVILPLRRDEADTKTCGKCRKRVRASYHLCPHCRTYFADTDEIQRRLASA